MKPSDLSDIYFKAVPQLYEIEAPVRKDQFCENAATRDIQTEFELLREVTDTKRHRQMLRTNHILQNKLNRFQQQEIYEHSRVVLKRSEPKQLDYINANHVNLDKDRMIITQGPLPLTINDFFTMIQQQKVDTVLMLCGVVENGKIKCQAYFDNLPEGFKLQQTEEINGRKLVRRLIRNTETKELITHIHYTDWPDKDVPKDYPAVRQVFQLVMESSNLLINCSAGIGRSGTAAVILGCLRELKRTEQTNVFRVARKVREQRYGSVQNLEQYRFIYDWLRWNVLQS